jgi:hypothetical protein
MTWAAVTDLEAVPSLGRAKESWGQGWSTHLCSDDANVQVRHVDDDGPEQLEMGAGS